MPKHYMNQSKTKRARTYKSASQNSSNRSGGFKRRPQKPKFKQKPSNIDPSQLVKKASVTEHVEYKSDRLVSELPINHLLKENLLQKGYKRPTEIQDRTLETLLSGRDLLGIAQTGTGKTAAFLIPIINQLLQHRKTSHTLILTPTRELANQIEAELKSMTKGLKIYGTCLIGGTNINKDLQNLRRPSHVVIATPGRLLDLVNRKALDLRKFNTLVLDEFDRMLDMGFVHDVKRIISGLQQRQHSLLFSATLDKSQERIIDEILDNPVTVKVSTGTTTGENIDQDVVRLKAGENKFDALYNLVVGEEFNKVILFEETKHSVSKLCTQLNKAGISADQIHGNKSQSARQRALNAFKAGKVKVLVATDVAARGIDVSDVSHVINYRIPATMDSYIHRIGRTGRAGKTGKALTFIN